MVALVNTQSIDGLIPFLFVPSRAPPCMKFVNYKRLEIRSIHMLNVDHNGNILIIKIWAWLSEIFEVKTYLIWRTVTVGSFDLVWYCTPILSKTFVLYTNEDQKLWSNTLMNDWLTGLARSILMHRWRQCLVWVSKIRVIAARSRKKEECLFLVKYRVRRCRFLRAEQFNFAEKKPANEHGQNHERRWWRNSPSCYHSSTKRTSFDSFSCSWICSYIIRALWQSKRWSALSSVQSSRPSISSRVVSIGISIFLFVFTFQQCHCYRWWISSRDETKLHLSNDPRLRSTTIEIQRWTAFPAACELLKLLTRQWVIILSFRGESTLFSILVIPK